MQISCRAATIAPENLFPASPQNSSCVGPLIDLSSLRSALFAGGDLTPKQKLFVAHYLLELNATSSAVAAGYSKKCAHSQGLRLLKNAEVSQAIAKKAQKVAEKFDISAEYVLGTIKQTIERCSRAIEVTDREGNPTGEWKEDSFAVLKGCELLGKYLKLFTDKVEHTGLIKHEHIDLSPYSDEQLAEIEALIESAEPRGNS